MRQHTTATESGLPHRIRRVVAELFVRTHLETDDFDHTVLGRAVEVVASLPKAVVSEERMDTSHYGRHRGRVRTHCHPQRLPDRGTGRYGGLQVPSGSG
jgi:hypothetical protein